MVMQFTINKGVLSAVTANGLARYGEPSKPAPAIALPSPRSLANPTGIQVLILILTVGLAGLALVGRAEWMLSKKAQAAQN